ncbi:MAG: hypothetical protein JO287_17820 [Pseudonocardiales bacterium]|nr:hypothetical protein [Pseudonocardiales bacterium]
MSSIPTPSKGQVVTYPPPDCPTGAPEAQHTDANRHHRNVARSFAVAVSTTPSSRKE